MAVLAIDAGTTGITCIIYAEDGRRIARAQDEFTQIFPAPGLVEHDAVEILETVLRVARDACKQAKLKPSKLAGIGITNQRETTVIWNLETGEPIHNAIVWQDGRTAGQCRKLKGKEKLVRSKTGLLIDPYFCATKVAWLLDNVPGARVAAEAGDLAFGTIDCWLAWKLTGEHVTDATNASRTLLWDIHRGQWDADLCELFGVPSPILPRVVPSSHIVGTCGELGGAPLAALVGDQQAALFGQGATGAGDAKNTYGTGCFMLQHTGTEAVASKAGLLTTRAASLDGSAQFALEGSVFIGGAAVQWLRDGLKLIESSRQIEALAATVDDSGGVVMVPAFTGLGAPYWKPEARGAILGLTRGTTDAHLARATLEAIALQCEDLMRAMAKDSGLKLTALRVDGGATANGMLMQMQADMSRVSIERPSDVEVTARGAGLLAGVALGIWDADNLPEQEFQSFAPTGLRYKTEKKAWKKAVKATMKFA